MMSHERYGYDWAVWLRQYDYQDQITSFGVDIRNSGLVDFSSCFNFEQDKKDLGGRLITINIEFSNTKMY